MIACEQGYLVNPKQVVAVQLRQTQSAETRWEVCVILPNGHHLIVSPVAMDFLEARRLRDFVVQQIDEANK